MATTNVILIPRFTDHKNRLQIFASAQVSLDVSAAHTIEMDMLPGTFSEAWLRRLTIQFINIATVDAQTAQMAGLELVRGGVIAHSFIPNDNRSWRSQADGAAGVTRMLFSWKDPLHTPLYPGDVLNVMAPRVDTNGSPTVDVIIRELSCFVTKW